MPFDQNSHIPDNFTPHYLCISNPAEEYAFHFFFSALRFNSLYSDLIKLFFLWVERKMIHLYKLITRFLDMFANIWHVKWGIHNGPTSVMLGEKEQTVGSYNHCVPIVDDYVDGLTAKSHIKVFNCKLLSIILSHCNCFFAFIYIHCNTFPC